MNKEKLPALFDTFRNERMLRIIFFFSKECLNDRKHGGLLQFINYSCDPNCYVEKWLVRGRMCLGIFSNKTSSKGKKYR